MTSNFPILVSLGLTFPAVISCAAVLYVWRRSLTHIPRRPQEWLMLGIAFSFTVHIADNLIWFSPWAFEYMGRGLENNVLFEYGIYVNIAFRQLMAIGAAYCHLRAAAASRSDFGLRAVTSLLALSHLAGFIFAFVFWRMVNG
jgi:hypothetical protein